MNVALLSGCAFVVAGWLLAFSWFGVFAFIVGAALIIGAAVAGRSVGGLVVPLAAGVLVFLSFPLIALAVNVAFWVGRGFRGP